MSRSTATAAAGSNPLLRLRAPSDKLSHYVGLRVQQALEGQSYRAGLFSPAAPMNAILFDLALIYDALLIPETHQRFAQSMFVRICTIAAEAMQPRHFDVTSLKLEIGAQRLHTLLARGGPSLDNLPEVIEEHFLRRFSTAEELTASQRELRHDLALVLSLEAQVVRASTLSALGVELDLTTLLDDRDQHLYLFCSRHGCFNKAELGEEEDTAGLREASTVEEPVPRDWLKRLMDVCGAAALLLLLSPVFLGLVVALRWSGGPAFYNQRRVGRGGRVFRCWKFRTMVPNAEQMLDRILASSPEAREEFARFSKLRNDPRITSAGRFLRKTSLDELPQLFNVLIGEMSLVGPRPIAVAERDRWGSYFRAYKRLRPGLTGPWQLYFRSDAPYDDQFEHAVAYARNWSVWADVRYLIQTVAVPFRQKGAY